ncbi:MAG: hypothetical protein JOY99_01630 [Sphingomonadaceae bacterium]|nr:hypothetical protein [Sphingomonadaceae bacterium]
MPKPRDENADIGGSADEPKPTLLETVTDPEPEADASEEIEEKGEPDGGGNFAGG